MKTTTATVAAITAVSVRGMRSSVSGLMLFQLKVPCATMIITATNAAMGIWATSPPSARISTRRKTPEAKVDSRVRPPERWLIIDWPIMAQPAIPPRNPVATLAMPWPRDSTILVGVAVGQVVEELRGEQRFEQADECQCDRDRQQDSQCCEGERHVGQRHEGQRTGQVTHVAHRGQLELHRDRGAGEYDDRDERRRHRSGEARKAVDDDESDGDEGQVQTDLAAIDTVVGQEDVRDLCHEDENRQRVHEPEHHRARNEPHERTDAEVAETDLDHAGENGGGEQVPDAVLVHEGHEHQRHRAGCGRDHSGASADE